MSAAAEEPPAIPSHPLTVPEAAQILRKSPRAINDAINRGEIPALRVGRTWKIPPRAFEAMFLGDDPAASTNAVREQAKAALRHADTELQALERRLAATRSLVADAITTLDQP